MIHVDGEICNGLGADDQKDGGWKRSTEEAGLEETSLARWPLPIMAASSPRRHGGCPAAEMEGTTVATIYASATSSNLDMKSLPWD